MPRRTRPTEDEMVNKTADMITRFSVRQQRGELKNTRNFKGGQHAVMVKDVLFPNQRLTNEDANRIVSKAGKKLGANARNSRMGWQF